MELNFQVVDSILAGVGPYNSYHCDGARWLMLDSFTSCSDEALDNLISNIGPIDGIDLGFKELSSGMAFQLRRLETNFLYLSGLNSLDQEAAHIIGAWSFDKRPIRTLTTRDPISVKAALGLVGKRPAIDQCDTPLGLSEEMWRHDLPAWLSRATAVID